MLHPLLFLHRWLGILVGLVMTIWCLSGFVMMYSPYPRLEPQEQLRGLAPLQLSLDISWDQTELADDMLLSSVRVEQMGTRAVLRATPAAEPGPASPQMRAKPITIDLATGRILENLAAQDALELGRGFGERFGIKGDALRAARIQIDQWTVQTARRHQPLYRVDYADGASVYIAGSGEVVQQTTRSERFWGWLGAVPHWLYPTLLRQDAALWSQVVIWTSLLGCFLSATGLWLGIARLRRHKKGRLGSPYRGLWWWHHMTGLLFGVLTLTWVASGLLSMNPWGLFESNDKPAERVRLAGPQRWGDLRTALGTIDALPAGTVRLETAPLGDTLFLAAVNASGTRIRINADGAPSPLTQDELSAALANGPGITALDLLHGHDAYYYAHRDPAPLPVWRAVLADAQQTRLYIDPQTGRVLRAFDGKARAYRWLMNGLHSLDFPGLHARPAWDLVVLPLLAMVTLVCATGTWMGISGARRDLRRLNTRRRHLPQARLQGVKP
ncbi:MAG TPA: PepSY domain-containing protein [Pedomonas sp.]|uniref:PepSY domain-containing protein n=1 Tax=Pedomonas sp. TaxID=2976421 RepID=UPI002F41F69F